MDILNPHPHTVLYPGLDHFKCGKCNKWICTSEELKSLKTQLENTKDKKRYAELRDNFAQEKYNSENCVKVDN
jgi:hypothetical protein